MLKISREVDLSLLLMVELAGLGKNEVLGLKNWTEENGLPYRFLSKVAVKLKKAGLLKSKEGREGGYKLGKAVKNIDVGEIVEAIEGPVAPVRCLQGLSCDYEGICGHKKIMSKLAKVVNDNLSEVSLKEIC